MTALSGSIRTEPTKVSVVLACFNAAEFLGQQLAALAEQEYQGELEFIIVDNGSTDSSGQIARQWDPGRSVSVIEYSEQKGQAPALNRGWRQARGELILICDADDVVSKKWLSSLVEVATDFDLVGGPLECTRLNERVVQGWRIPPKTDRFQLACGYLPYAFSGNCAIWRDVLEELDGFDESHGDIAGRDIDFSWRLQLRGYKMGFVPGAIVHYRYRTSLAALARQFYNYGRANGLLFSEFRRYGMPRRLLRHLAVWGYVLLYPLFGVWTARGRGRLTNYASYQLGRAVSCFQFRTLYP
jgi:glycosyltransferase involved in cell wall biosynthesis